MTKSHLSNTAIDKTGKKFDSKFKTKINRCEYSRKSGAES